MSTQANANAEWFGSDFGQKIDLTVRIREILLQYPQGTSILKELIQNSDDAGGREVKFCIDLRSHGTSRLPSTTLAQFQGPALLVYNSGVFTDADFASIQRIGDSLKKDSSKGSKTGRFGIGFNSIYHLSELPSFVSGHKWCCFDPQAQFLPNVNPSNPGKMVDFLEHKAVIEQFPDQFSPLMAFGCDFRAPYGATLFRFPLRTSAQAAASKLSRQTHSVESMRALLREFIAESTSFLLFLKRVESLAVYEWLPGQPAPTLVHETRLASPSAALRQSRAFALNAAGGGSAAVAAADGVDVADGKPPAPKEVDYEMELVSEPQRPWRDETAAAARVAERWLVCNQLGGAGATAIANRPDLAHMRFVPWAGVAALLGRTVSGGGGGGGGEDKPPELEGAAFCFLPLPVATQLPVHVNGYFELSSNRRDIWQGDDMAGDGRVRAEWNKALVGEVAAACYLRLLRAAALAVGPGALYDRLWPRLETLRGVWRGGAEAVLAGAAGAALLHSRLGGGGNGAGTWVCPQDAILLAPNASGPPSAAAGSAAVAVAAAAKVRMLRLGTLLLAEGAPVVDCDGALQASLLAAGCARRSATPAVVRDLLRSAAAATSGLPKSLTTAGAAVAAAAAGGGGGGGNPRENALFLLAYCLEDLVPAGTYQELQGLPLLPLADG
ncbi:unnamed protein product [Phaeothamnion confervicola]